MHQWDPATDAEAAMRDALAAADQDGYFRILARSDLLLPVSAEALAGRAPMGWGTWTTGNRTHVLAFTSPAAMRLCLNEPYGSYRSVPFSTLAHEWPNHEWWLAINPGLPIEAYLPAWFISQLVRGDVRLPGRTGARARMAQSDLAAAISGRIRAAERSRAAAPPPPRSAPPPPAPAPPPAPVPPSTALAPIEAPFYGPADGSGYGPAGGYGPGYAPYEGYPGYGPPGGYGPGYGPAGGPSGVQADMYGWSEAYQQPAYDPQPGYGGRDVYGASDGWSDGYRTAPPPAYGPVEGGAGGPEPYPEEPPPPPTRVTASVGPPPVETVDAEIIDAGPADRDGAANGAEYGSDATTRMTAQNLGARLREHQAYGSDTYGSDTYGSDTYGSDTYGSDAYGSGANGSDAYGSATPSTDGPSVRAEPPPAPTPTQPSSWTPRRGMIEDAEIVSPEEAWAAGFVPANETEVNLLSAVESNNTDAFLSTLLLARVILPVPISMPPGSRPRDKYFPWQIEEVDGERRISVFTSEERLADYGRDRFGADMSTMSMRFIELIEAWPSPRIQFAINPGTPVGTTLPGSQIVALASWAAEVGLRHDSPHDVVPRKPEATSMGVAGAPTVGAENAVLMQRAVPPEQLSYYLERGYDRVSGFVNRASEVAHLKTPRALYRALGLVYPGSPFSEDDTEVHVLRWVAHRPDLYRLPYGGQNEAAMRAMQGWVIERPPFRGNGFAPGDTDVVAEFKVDSVRLPHGAQMWRLTQDGTEELVASFDADKGRWVRTP